MTGPLERQADSLFNDLQFVQSVARRRQMIHQELAQAWFWGASFGASAVVVWVAGWLAFSHLT
jgi:hypothetical protein